MRITTLAATAGATLVLLPALAVGSPSDGGLRQADAGATGMTGTTGTTGTTGRRGGTGTTGATGTTGSNPGNGNPNPGNGNGNGQGKPPAGTAPRGKAYGFYCKQAGASKKKVAGQKGTPFSQCVKAMKALDTGKASTPAKACKGISKKKAEGKNPLAVRLLRQGRREAPQREGLVRGPRRRTVAPPGPFIALRRPAAPPPPRRCSRRGRAA
jgi:hypothetical protein